MFFEYKVEEDGRVPRSGDRDICRGRTLIRMVSLIMRMYMLKVVSEIRKADRDTKGRKPERPKNYDSRAPAELLSSLSNFSVIETPEWSRLTEVTRDNRLLYEMFQSVCPKGSTGAERGYARAHNMEWADVTRKSENFKSKNVLP